MSATRRDLLGLALVGDDLARYEVLRAARARLGRPDLSPAELDAAGLRGTAGSRGPRRAAPGSSPSSTSPSPSSTS